jgi:hypothetical protein
MKGLEDNIFDFPYALLYSVVDDMELEADDGASISQGFRKLRDNKIMRLGRYFRSP